MKQPTITARQLRHLLFAIDNQEMTIGQLRAVLFESEQDQPYSIEDLGCWINAVNTMRKIQREAK